MGDLILRRYNEGGDPTVLHEAVRRLLKNHNAALIDAANHADMTDESTGTGVVTAPLIPPSAPYTAGTAAAQNADLNSALDAANNAQAILMDTMNDLRAVLGLAEVGEGDGTKTTPDTVPAIDQVITSVNDGTAVAFGSGVAKMQKVANNMATLCRHANKLARAVGIATIADLTGAHPNVVNEGLVNNAADTVAGAATNSISKAAADAFMVNVANSVAGITAKVRAVIAVTAATNAPLNLISE